MSDGVAPMLFEYPYKCPSRVTLGLEYLTAGVRAIGAFFITRCQQHGQGMLSKLMPKACLAPTLSRCLISLARSTPSSAACALRWMCIGLGIRTLIV